MDLSDVATGPHSTLFFYWQVRVTDLKGNSLGSLKVTANSATRESDEVVIISKEMLTPVSKAE